MRLKYILATFMFLLFFSPPLRKVSYLKIDLLSLLTPPPFNTIVYAIINL